MKKISCIICLLFLFSHYALAKKHASEAEAEAEWEVIPVLPVIEIIDDNGDQKTIYPACAFDAVDAVINTVPSQEYTSYKFYFKPGKNDKLVVFFNGGGACWDSATCLSSLAGGGSPTYNPSIDEANSPDNAGGIFNDNNDANPFKDWSKVFIPYCTGDIHIGSNTVLYDNNDSIFGGYPQIPVNHRGFDNFLAVREWIKEHFSTESNNKANKLEKLLVTGSSAGGYGATLNFPYLQNAFPKTNAVLLSDGAAAVVTPGFLDTVFSVGGNWNLEETLATDVFGEYSLGYFYADTFNKQLLTNLTESYPQSRFAQYTTAFDAVQVQFLKIMTKIDGGATAPEDWGFKYVSDDGFVFSLSLEDQELFGFWNWKMNVSLAAIADDTDNYQYYIGKGTVHTILTDAFAINENHHPFYDENSADGVYFSDWIDRFVNSEDFNEENLNYINSY